MRTLCPNLDRDDALETVLEVPVPEEIFGAAKIRSPWPNIMSWMKSSPEKTAASALFGGKGTEIQLLLGVVGAPLIPLPIHSRHFFNKSFANHPIERSMAKYIVQQYIAAAGGDGALNSIQSMCATGKVRMATTEVVSGEALSNNNGKGMKGKSLSNGGGEMGGFVLWQKRPDLWNLELVVSGYKISAGSDGKVAWRQTPWHHSHASRGPPRPLRRSLQGLDPRSTANLFSNSICTGEKSIHGEDCFVLKLEVEPTTLRARSSSNVEIIRHSIWGYFSQKTGLIVHLEDTHLLRIRTPANEVFWETTMESQIRDYRTVDGVNIAHSGRTTVSLCRFGESSESHTRTRMEEVWEMEEVDFNIKGLSLDCFLPPRDLKREDEENEVIGNRRDRFSRNETKSPFRVRSNVASRISAIKSVTKVVSVDDEDYIL